MAESLRPSGERLHLGSSEITWERFEQFCLALFSALPDVASANRYGMQGDHQEGIDHEITFRDGRSGAAQCRQRAKFGKSDFDNAVAGNEYQADCHLVVTSAPATAQARKAARETPGWELWDVDDIGVRVRALPRVDARWLIEDHLGEQQRRDFLGPHSGLTLARWQRRFRRLLEPDRLFSHTLPLVGRAAALARLGEFVGDRKQQIAIAPGRGGSGKSRLLLEFARLMDTAERPILFATEGSLLTTHSLEAELPGGAAVLVLDDAHRRGDVDAIIGYAEGHPELKLVLATRPHGSDGLLAATARLGFAGEEVCKLTTLEPLERDASRALALAATDGAQTETADALGDLTRDCQLLTVLAGRLLRQKLIPLGLLANEEQLRTEVLARFRDELLGLVPETVPRDTLRRLLAITAAVQPVRDSQRDLLNTIATRLGCAEHEIILWLDELERAGLLLRAGELRRVTPDVLGDFVLEQASVDDHGKPTGYATWLWGEFARVAASRLIVNLAELDWRIRVGTGASTLLDQIWGRLRREYEKGDAYARWCLLELLAPIAIMQPERLLEIAELELGAPAATSTDPIFDASWSAIELEHKLAPIVKNAGLYPQHTRRAMRLLWRLGREDERPQPQNLDHGLRLLVS